MGGVGVEGRSGTGEVSGAAGKGGLHPGLAVQLFSLQAVFRIEGRVSPGGIGVGGLGCLLFLS